MTIGKRIKAGRIARGLSQEDIAKEMFLTRQTISKWENDKSIPDIYNFIFLSNLLEVTVAELSGISDFKKPNNEASVQAENKRRQRDKLRKRTGIMLMIAFFTLLFALMAHGIYINYVTEKRTEESIAKRYLTVYGVETINYKLKGDEHSVKDDNDGMVSFLLADGSLVDDLSYKNIKSLGLLNQDNQSFKSSELEDFAKTKQVDMLWLLKYWEEHSE